VFGSTPIRTFAGDHIQLSLVDIPADGVVDWHSHPNEQIGMMVAGRAVFQIGDEEKTLGPGDFYLIPGGVRHRVVPVSGPAQALDVFYPIREEYK
jgi:quercetin dioxygenase-like cupin family protein